MKGGILLGRRAGAFVALLGVACTLLSCGGEPQQGVLAKVEGKAITKADLEKRMEGMPAYMRKQFETPEGRERLLDGLIEEELYFREARATGLDKRAEFEAEMERARRNTVIRHYYEKVIEMRSAVADSELVAYYNGHPEEFRVGAGDSTKPFSDVRDDIAARLGYLKRRDIHSELLGQLKQKYNVSVVDDSVAMSEAVDPDLALAVIDGEELTRADLDRKLAAFPGYMQEQFKSPQGRKRLLEGSIEEEIFYREALATGLHKQEDYKKEIDRIERNVLIKAYFDKAMAERSEPTDEEVREYYEAHPDEFSHNQYARVRHIMVATEDEAAKLRRRLSEGADFAELAKDHSIDASTKDGGGLIDGVILPQYPVPNLGMLPEFSKACFGLEEGEISAPVLTDRGYHLIRVEERGKDYVSPFEDVKADVASRVRMEKRRNLQGTLLAELKTKYEVVYLADVGTPTPEDLFKLASESSNPREKIRYYEQFLEKYPDNDRAYEAKFMIGFTFAEDLRNHAEAEKVFNEFLEEYPQSDLADDANWMLENMASGETPVFVPEGN